MYGPIPIIDENIPVGADIEEVRLFQQPVDSVANYIVKLLDEASEGLPLKLLILQMIWVEQQNLLRLQ